MKLAILIKMCLSETYGRFRVGKHLSDMFLIRNVLSSLFFNLVIDSAIVRVQTNQYGLKLNGTHQLLVYADAVDILGGNLRTIKENAKASIMASKESELHVNGDKLNTWSCFEIRMQDEATI